jgi:hypothetical protein
MHPYLLETFAHDRAAAIAHSGGARSSRQPSYRQPSYRQPRQRIGWMLVTVGLRLIGDGRARRHPAPIGG